MYAQGYNGPFFGQMSGPVPQATAQHIMDLEQTIKNLRKENQKLREALWTVRNAVREVIDD